MQLVGPSDAQELLAIYAYYVQETPISLELRTPDLEEFAQRIEQIIDYYPWLKLVVDGQIVGYAYGSPFKERRGYEHTAEVSVYLDKNYSGRGLGGRLYAALLRLLKEQGIRRVIGGVTLPNEPSVRLHERFGFRAVAKFSKVGYKFDKWWDVGYWQLSWEGPPNPKFHPFSSIASRWRRIFSSEAGEV